jgi:hypothetical protein
MLLPTDIGGCILFLRGDSAVNFTTGIWGDISGSGNSTTPQGAPRPSASALNGKASVLFPNALNQGQVTPSLSLASFTIGSVFKAASAGYALVHNTDANTNGCYLYTGTTNTNVAYRSSVSSDKKFTAGLADSVVRSVIWTFDQSTATNLLYLNGALATETTNTGNNPVGTASGLLYIGAGQIGNGAFHTLNLGEVFVLTRAMSALDVLHLYNGYHRPYWGV